MRIGTLKLEHNIFLAPMAGITDLAFRTIAREFGAAFCYTEMISAPGLIRQGRRTFRYLVSSPKDRPLGAQIFGADPRTMAEAARIVTGEGVDLIDINMGCPVKKVIKSGAGAALMKDPSLASQIISSVRQATELPVTVKLRSGWRQESINCIEISRMAEDCGADAVTIHPRTAAQGFRGSANRELIEKVKKVLSIPVIASGDLWTPADATRIFYSTGCDGIMIARGSLGNPWIFKGAAHLMTQGMLPPPPAPLERKKTIERHLDMSIALYGETVGMRSFRKHLLWYTKGLRGGGQFRGEAAAIKEKGPLLALLDRFLQSLEDGAGTGPENGPPVQEHSQRDNAGSPCLTSEMHNN